MSASLCSVPRSGESSPSPSALATGLFFGLSPSPDSLDKDPGSTLLSSVDEASSESGSASPICLGSSFS